MTSELLDKEIARIQAQYQQVLINTLVAELAKANLALKEAQRPSTPTPNGEAP